ncbi:type II toxin-antitoxin system HicB family antitoxin [Acaryochloris marina]|uniref:HicB-like antitoxin of toxin-antitoxin system domain-containing protein n=1 Tax=Acaryochloris marina (strain MBIC 11017) TaxID=329726 RepID=B0C2W6_ACAM1|nr:hypothetical protein [Acaryochloris marina]ABW26182.1 conserved hypothetical protein [Acaryochloris marina MBIC11017]
MSNYIRAVMSRATYTAAADGSTYGEIPGFEKVSARADTLEQCRHDLVESLEEWIFSRVTRQLPVPIIDGIQLPTKEMM